MIATTRTAIISLLTCAILVGGCKTLDTISDYSTKALVATGTISSSQATSINKSVSAVGKTFDSFTPEQEYFVGRTVAAVILSKNKAYDKISATRYLNRLGQVLALFSERPETFGGYHFLIMDSEEINAFAAPGGLILVSRGMLRCCQTEDELAAVLAHEIAHVAQKHGLQAIQKSRVTSALTILGTEAVKNLAGGQLDELTKNFEDSVSDIISTTVNNGYARELEESADTAAIKTLQAVGYDPRALVSMLRQMQKRLNPSGKDFNKTHPKPEDRIVVIEKLINSSAPATPSQAAPARQERFKDAIGSV